MLPEDAMLLPEIVDAIFLVAIHPANQGQHEEVQSVGHGRRLHGSNTAVTHVVSGIHSPRPFSRGPCVVPIPQGPEAGEAERVLAVGPHAAPEPVPRLTLATGLAQALYLSRFAWVLRDMVVLLRGVVA